MKKTFSDFLKINGRSFCPHLRILGLVAVWVAGSCSVMNGQTTYNWTGATSTAYGTSTNWSPSRTTTANTDILRFNSGSTVTVTNVTSQTIGQLLVLNNTTVDLQSTAGVTTSINGGTGTDLSVESGSSLNVSGGSSIQISLLTGTTASISGNMSFTSTTASTSNRLLAADASAITFNSGAVITQGTNSVGNLFGNSGTLNVANFASGSTFIQSDGSNPFGLTTPDSKVVFQTGSLFKFQIASGSPAFSGRTYGNYEFNASGSATPTGASAVSIDNLTITQGTLNFNVTGTPGHAIKGNISVASSAKLQFNPASAVTINFNGTAAQSITNTSGGTLSFSANTSVVVDNSAGVTFNQAQTFSGGVTVNANALLATSAALTFSGTIAVNGKLQLNSGGSVSKAPTYNNTSTLIYNSTYSVSNEWTGNTTTVGVGIPQNILVQNSATVTLSAARSLASNLTVQLGSIIATPVTLTIGSTTNINGTFQINQGGYATGGTWNYGTTGTLVYNNSSGPYGAIDNTHVYWPASNGPINVTVQNGGGINMGVGRTVSGTFLLVTGTNAVQGNALTLNGTVQINGGNFQSSPIYGSSSLLKYNANATYGRNNEWAATGVGTIGTTAGYPNNVQLSNNTTLNFPNGSNTARACNSNLTIDAGSSLYSDYSGGSVNMTVGGSLSIAGNMSLGGSSGGDLTVKGNFTRTGTFTPNGRAIYFNAVSGDQTITGATTFDYIFVDKAAGNVVLANAITCNQTLTLTTGKISTGSNSLIISSSGSVSRTNGWVIGNLQKNIATGSNVARTYEIGDASNYTPVSITFASVSAVGDVTATVAAVAHPNFNSSTLSQTKYAQRYWTLTNASTTFTTYNATFTYVSGDLQGSALGNSLVVGRYASATWTYPTFSNTGSTTTATGLNAFGEFILAEMGCVNPTAFSITGGGAYCSGGTGVAIGLSNSETGVDYQLILSAANNGSAVSGTSSAISFGLKTVAGTYTVLGTRTTGGCSTTMTGNAVVTVNPRPTIAISNKVGDPCMLGVGAVTITGSGGTGPLSITWTAAANASRPVGATGSATGSPAGTAQTSPVTYTSLTGWYDYNFLVTDSNGCTAPSIGNQ